MAALVMLAVAAGGCAPPASQGGFDSDNPASKLYAIRKATHGDIDELVEQLESDDPAVRMMSISALERLTGERMGYNPYDSLADRHDAVGRWVHAVAAGDFETGATATSEP